VEIIAVIVAGVVAWRIIAFYLKKKRREALLAKYGDAELVHRILTRMFWQGQTEEQLLDSLGSPLGIDTKVLKTKTKEIWKYNELGKNRYGLKITLEDGLVVGWEQK
jgi:hypothetical protein